MKWEQKARKIAKAIPYRNKLNVFNNCVTLRNFPF